MNIEFSLKHGQLSAIGLIYLRARLHVAPTHVAVRPLEEDESVEHRATYSSSPNKYILNRDPNSKAQPKQPIGC